MRGGPIHAYMKRYKDYLKMASSLFDERDVRARCERAADCP
jgi:tRNA isopentenyl-2-thiomethyl-A-37 hydroxylase MiaE